MADVWFAKAAPAPTLGELLSAPQADLLGSKAVDAKPAEHTASTAGLVIHRNSLEDELLRGSTPLV